MAKQNGVSTCILTLQCTRKLHFQSSPLGSLFILSSPSLISKNPWPGAESRDETDSKHWLALSVSIKYLCAERKSDRKTELIDTLELIPYQGLLERRDTLRAQGINDGSERERNQVRKGEKTGEGIRIHYGHTHRDRLIYPSLFPLSMCVSVQAPGGLDAAVRAWGEGPSLGQRMQQQWGWRSGGIAGVLLNKRSLWVKHTTAF